MVQLRMCTALYVQSVLNTRPAPPITITHALITMPLTSLIITPLLMVGARKRERNLTGRESDRWVRGDTPRTVNECQDRRTHWKIKPIRSGVWFAFLFEPLNSWKKRTGRGGGESESFYMALCSVMLGEQKRESMWERSVPRRGRLKAIYIHINHWLNESWN